MATPSARSATTSSLGPGEERRLVYVLGLTDHPEEIGAVVARYRDEAAVEVAFEELRADWRAVPGALHRRDAGPRDDRDAATSGTRSSVGRRSTGRASCPGTRRGWGAAWARATRPRTRSGRCTACPGRPARTLTRTWRLQFRDGHAWHQIFPLSGEGGPGLAAEFPGWPQWFSDDHLWLVLATCAYLRETGDLAYLDARVPWADGDAGTIWGHMQHAVAFTLAHRGPHGLPRAGFADWDDTLNVDHGSGRAESVWCAMQFCRAVLDLADLSRHAGRSDEAARFGDLHREMAACVNDVAWDGSWYARAFDDDGRPIGVASETTHRINLNPQTWSVIGEVAPPDRAERALDAVAERLLATPFGTALLWPPYDGGDDRVRGTATYPPGAKENGGIFCHANTWLIIAAAMLGRADDAYAHYRRILPLARSDADVYRAEPYVYSQNICGPAHPQFGMARNAWLTGTAAWAFVAATQWILGIRPTFEGLQIAPAIPASWPGFEARREFRGVTYEIRVRRDGPGATVSLVVDGRPVAGIRRPAATTRHAEGQRRGRTPLGDPSMGTRGASLRRRSRRGARRTARSARALPGASRSSLRSTSGRGRRRTVRRRSPGRRRRAPR